MKDQHEMYVLRVSVTLFRDVLPADEGEALCGMRTQEVSGDLADVLSQVEAVGAMAEGMALVVASSENFRTLADKAKRRGSDGMAELFSAMGAMDCGCN